MKDAPTLDEFVEHGEIRLQMLKKDPRKYRTALIAKYLSWEDNDWHTGHGKKIKNWRSTLTNTLPYLMAEDIEVNEPETLFEKFRKKQGL